MINDIDDFNYNLGRAMKIYRENAKLTREQMADILGCNVSHIAGIERGRVRTTAYETAVYAEKCGIGAGKLMGLNEISIPLANPLTKTEETGIVGICASLRFMTDRTNKEAYDKEKE